MRRTIGTFAHSALGILALCLVAVVCIASTASATSLNARLNAARALLEAGDTQAALAAYHELQVEDPESKAMLLGMACGIYRSAENYLQTGDKDKARELFEVAGAAFDGVLAIAKDGETRAIALFDSANATAQLSKMAVADAEEDPNLRKDAIEALRDAVRAYEGVQNVFPGHAGAQQNLDHMRYLLKVLLQQKEEQQPPMHMYSFISEAHTDLPGATVRVLPPKLPQEGEAEALPPAGNTAVLQRESAQEETP